jgi:hypothetical protein
MELELMKYQFIEEVIRLNNKEVLFKLKTFLQKEIKQNKPTKNINDFFGIWNKEEAQEVEEIIKTEFSKIDDESWR